ncbi:MAG: CapA family protein [Lachnospiraceae bacterium]|nr:CapA family protein [Lachnospiraceae bacterium]
MKKQKRNKVKNKLLAFLLLVPFTLSGCAGAQPTGAEATETISVVQGVDIQEWLSGVATVTGEETTRIQANISEEMAVIDTQVVPEVTLVMVGDMLMHMPVNNSGKMEDGTMNFDHLFTYTKDMISEADVAIVNQEVMLGGTELGISGYPRFNTYYEVGDALVNAGFDVVLHATNHTMDRGKDGLMNCLKFWETNYPDMAILGIQDTAEEQDEIYVYEHEGIKVAILNYTYGLNGLPMPSDMPFAVNMIKETQIAEDVARAKEVADFVVLCPHWGTEYVLEETNNQRLWAEFFLECGVDLVIGTHPHVIEPAEMWTDEDGNEMLVYYSLGNYVNATASEERNIGWRMLGAMATVTLSRDENGEVYIKEYGAEPLVTYVSSDKKEISVYPMEQFTEEMAASSFTVKRDPNFTRARMEEIWEQVFGDLPEYESE